MEVTVDRVGERAYLRISGRFDIHSNMAFRNACRPLLSESGINAVVVDFAKVPYMDSSALGMLLLLREQAQAAGKSVVLTQCGPDLQRVLSIAHFGSIFRIE